jgi:hypothetical protein
MTTFNKIFYQLAVILMLSQISCVQKSFERTVKVTLDVSQIPNIKTVGVRGEGKPLSWDEDLAMKVVVPDSLYSIEMTGTTGYKFLEIKYVVNGEFELQDQPNRRIYFDENSPVTIANHTFNNIK